MDHMTRRHLFSLPTLAPIASLWPSQLHAASFNRVMGTSLEIVTRGTPQQAIAIEAAVLEEIARLSSQLSTYHPTSVISRDGKGIAASTEATAFHELMSVYAAWERRTGGVISAHLSGPGSLNVDALGKPYILEQAAAAAKRSVPKVEGFLINCGGDIVVRGSGSAWPVGIADPAAPAENARPLTMVSLTHGAVTTSGGYARGEHIVDPRRGQPAQGARSVTVVARTGVTANALSTALCVLETEAGLQLVRDTPGAECLVVTRDGQVVRSAGFARYEQPVLRTVQGTKGWGDTHEVAISLTLKSFDNPRARRPYVAIWVEDSKDRLVRNVAAWASKRRWIPDLYGWYKANNGAEEIYSMTRATRAPGKYRVVWDGLDEQGKPVPAGSYKIAVEVNREHGNYSKEAGVIACGGKPASVTLKETAEFDAVTIEYGAKVQTA